MRKWGLLITFLYALTVVFLLIPLWVYLGGDTSGWVDVVRNVIHLYRAWFIWLFVAFPLIGEGLLLFVRVDISQRRLKPRTHILISSIASAFFLAVLTFCGLLCIGVALRGDKAVAEDARHVATAIGLAWLFWAIVFYRMNRNSSDIVSRGVTWLMRGSVLELLIAVPAHVIVRRRDECSAPIATSFGITTGLAVMLLAFGPSILILYKQRLEQYSRKALGRKAAAASHV